MPQMNLESQGGKNYSCLSLKKLDTPDLKASVLSVFFFHTDVN